MQIDKKIAEQKCIELIREYQNIIDKMDDEINLRAIIFNSSGDSWQKSFRGKLHNWKTERMARKVGILMSKYFQIINNMDSFIDSYYKQN